MKRDTKHTTTTQQIDASTQISINNNVNIINVHNTTIINNVTNIHNTYINIAAPGAVTAVPANAFVRGQPVAAAARPLGAQQLAHVQFSAGAPAIAPVRESFAGGMRSAGVSAPALLTQRQVVATRAPVIPAAYHDTLAQRFAGNGGRVEGAGEPVVRTATLPVPEAAHGAKPGEEAASSRVRVIDRTQVHPVASQGTALRAGESAHEPSPAQQEVHVAHGPENQAQAQQHAVVTHENEAANPRNEVPREQMEQHAVQPSQGKAEAVREEATPRAPDEARHGDVAKVAVAREARPEAPMPHANEAAPAQHANPHPEQHPHVEAHSEPHKPADEHRENHTE